MVPRARSCSYFFHSSYAHRISLVIIKTRHSRFCDRTGFFRKYKLLDFGSFLVDSGHMLGLELLIDGKLLLCMVLLARAHIILAETVVRVWKVRIQLQCPLV